MEKIADKRAPIRVGFYDIERTIGKGNFAVVKLARHRLTKTEVAIKIIDKTQLGAADLKRAYREVRVLKKLHHPHIIRIYQVMETKNMLYIVTEYASSGEIFEHISNHGRLPEPSARRLYWQVVSAVDYCHKRGVVHRDLKAENLLLDVEGNVKLADFGFSTWWSKDNSLSTWCGSPPYAAPEVFQGLSYTGPEIDIWSLGVVLYVLVCGALPFDAPTLPHLRDRVLSARYRVPYFLSAECESLVRKMLVKDPTKRYTIALVKRHRWMQMDGPIRLLPSTAGPIPSTANHKQYLDPGLINDIPSEPNDQVLRIMASLGIDSNKTRESLRHQSYDHHAAIYFLLLERLKQHRPGSGRFSTGAPPTVSRMMSQTATDTSNTRRPRRPSSVAENAMRKMVPGGNSSESQQIPHQPIPATTNPGTINHPERAYWKSQRHGGPPPQSGTSSVDEGVADMDSIWGDDPNGSLVSGKGSSSAYAYGSSANASTSKTQQPRTNNRADWKLARGSTGSSAQISSDLSQASGSVTSSGTTLSSWDSAWEPASGLASAAAGAASLPSCSNPTQPSERDGREGRRASNGPESPLSPSGPCLLSWMPPHPGSPTEFRLGRRASDGLVGRNLGCKLAFTNKLEGGRAGARPDLAAALIENSQNKLEAEATNKLIDEEGLLGEPPMSEFPMNLLCSPAKRPSLTENHWSHPHHLLGETSLGAWAESLGACSLSNTSTQLHRQMMALRLQRRTGVVDAPDLSSLDSAAASAARRSVLRQQSYKLAQQQPVMPPLPINQPQGNYGLDSIFRPISAEASNLHAHEEEDEDEEEEDEVSCIHNPVGDLGQPSCWTNENVWQTLPVTLGDCKLTDSNSSLSSRLSPLLLTHLQSSGGTSPIPFRWDHHSHHHHLHHQQNTMGGGAGGSHHLATGHPQSNILLSQERMDTGS